MGLLQMLFGPKKPEFKERIWSTAGRKLDDLVAQVRDSQERGIHSVVVAHFKATHKALLEALEKGGARFWSVTSLAQFPFDAAGELRKRAATLALLSDSIPPSVTPTVRAEAKDAALSLLSVHLAEHYPLPGRDQQVLALDRVWPMPINFTCYTGLDEPWLAPFGIEKARELLTKLGVDESTVLENLNLNRAFASAQKRLAQQVAREQICESCADWMQRNFHGR